MALFSFSAQYVRRSDGSSAVAMAAYRAGVEILDERTGLRHDYSAKAVEHSEILAPEGAPEWVYDRDQLWNVVEKRADYTTRRATAVLAREMRIALPRELSREAQLELTRTFLREEFVSRGMVADWSLHDEPGKNQPHVHVMLTVRKLDPDLGFGNREEAWDQKSMLYHWREQWAAHANRALERQGHEARIDHRSYATRGIDIEAQPKLYRAPEDAERDQRDHVRERWDAYRETAWRNGERIRADPSIALRLLTEQRATFRRDDLLKVLHTHTLDAEQFGACLHAVMASPELVSLGVDEKGVERFTSREMRETERRLLKSADSLSERDAHRVDRHLVEQAIARADQRLMADAPADSKERARVSDEQRSAIAHLTHDTGRLALLEGRAGTGKSFLLGAARDAWEAQGFTVVGGALAGKAAEELELSSSINSRTLASWERSWGLGRDQLTNKHVLVIDEAGMLGTRQLERVIEHARKAGAKVVLVGDSRQLQAIEAGSPFRALAERLSAAQLSEVRRQRVTWQREASEAFGSGKAQVAVDAYHDHQNVSAHRTIDEARVGVVRSWAADAQSTPLKKRLMLAYRRDDVRELNRLAREHRREAGELGPDRVVSTANGEQTFAQGDRIYFGKNDHDLKVKNGSLGTIEDIRGDVMLVRLDGAEPRQVFVDLGTYNHVDHGYAVTVHKSQGATVDRTYVLASKLFDASKTYVALSRHRDNAELHWARDEFGTRRELDRILTREVPKELAYELEDLDLVSRHSTLDEVLKDDSRFALLAPDHQRKLVEELEAELSKATLADKEKEFAKLPEVVAAHAKAEKAIEHYVQLTRQLEQERALPKRSGLLDKLTGAQRDDELRLRELERATDEAKKVMTHAMVDRRQLAEGSKGAPLHARAHEIVEACNRPVHDRRARLGEWRDAIAAVERAGMLEAEVERLRKDGRFGDVRLADKMDCEVEWEVAGTRKLGTLVTRDRAHCALLQSTGGENVLVMVPSVQGVATVTRGQRVQLQQTERGLVLGVVDRQRERERGHEGHGGR